MMESSYSLNNFEKIYLHLSTENQEKLDSGFASELITSDIQEKTASEVVESLSRLNRIL